LRFIQHNQEAFRHSLTRARNSGEIQGEVDLAARHVHGRISLPRPPVQRREAASGQTDFRGKIAKGPVSAMRYVTKNNRACYARMEGRSCPRWQEKQNILARSLRCTAA
jgi:hypothetical protein